MIPVLARIKRFLIKNANALVLSVSLALTTVLSLHVLFIYFQNEFVCDVNFFSEENNFVPTVGVWFSLRDIINQTSFCNCHGREFHKKFDEIYRMEAYTQLTRHLLPMDSIIEKCVFYQEPGKFINCSVNRIGFAWVETVVFLIFERSSKDVRRKRYRFLSVPENKPLISLALRKVNYLGIGMVPPGYELGYHGHRRVNFNQEFGYSRVAYKRQSGQFKHGCKKQSYVKNLYCNLKCIDEQVFKRYNKSPLYHFTVHLNISRISISEKEQREIELVCRNICSRTVSCRLEMYKVLERRRINKCKYQRCVVILRPDIFDQVNYEFRSKLSGEDLFIYFSTVDSILRLQLCR